MEQLKRKDIKYHTERVLQFGEGNFLRGFVDWMFDKMNKECGKDFGIVVVQPLPSGRIEYLNKQEGIYTLYTRGYLNGIPSEETRIIDCITRGIDPYKNRGEYLKCAENPNLRYIISNTTEAGIEYRREAEDFDAVTFPGRLTIFLKARFDAKLPGFLILPCELIDNNADMLKKYILAYARDWNYGEDFIRWVNEENVFMNTLVDRIVTGAPKDGMDDVYKKLGYIDEMYDSAEMFHLWVIEGDKKYSSELPFEKAGLNVVWTDDVTPYKKRKVRILNGAHTMLVSAALLMGEKTVRESMNNELLLKYVTKGVYEEIIPAAVSEKMPQQELKSFADNVIERFKNPFIDHYLESIALNSVSKYSVRDLPSVKDYYNKFGKLPECTVFALAALIMLYKSGKSFDSAENVNIIDKSSVDEILSNISLWGEDLSFLKEEVKKYIAISERNGIAEGIKSIL